MKYTRYATYREAREHRDGDWAICRLGCGKKFAPAYDRDLHEWATHGAPHPAALRVNAMLEITPELRHFRTARDLLNEEDADDADFNRRVDACAECDMGENYADADVLEGDVIPMFGVVIDGSRD